METDQGDKGDACLLPVNADRSQHEDAAYFSLLPLLSVSLSLFAYVLFLLDLSIFHTPVLSL